MKNSRLIFTTRQKTGEMEKRGPNGTGEKFDEPVFLFVRTICKAFDANDRKPIKRKYKEMKEILA